jgi:hypothetical protein
MGDWIALLVLAGFIAVIIGLLWWLQWMKAHCPTCKKPWSATGQIQNGGLMAGRRAYMKQWRCPACGYSEWIKSF